MKKTIFLSLLAAMIAVCGANAKNSESLLVANLYHDGHMTPFYGQNALSEAHEAAEHGDTITLSGGTFGTKEATLTISKALTIIGAGIYDSYDYPETELAYQVQINITDNVDYPFHFEGVRTPLFNIIKVTPKSLITKCSLGEYYAYIDCYDEITIINSYVSCLRVGSSTKGVCNLINCRVFLEKTSFNLTNLYYIVADNCYFFNSTDDYQFFESTFRNCIFNSSKFRLSGCFSYYCYSTQEDLFTGITGNNNSYIQSSQLSDYRPTEENRNIIIGNDGTEAGTYGGVMPFNVIPTNPQITKFNVYSQSQNSKVVVELEVNGEE